MPLLGGLRQPAPAHFALAGGLFAFGALLWTRQRLGKRPASLAPVAVAAARLAGGATLGVCVAIGAIVLVIFGARLRSGGSFGALSVGMPVVALAWLASLGRKAWRHREPIAEDAAPSERPSRRPPSWDAAAGAKASQRGSSNRQVSA